MRSLFVSLLSLQPCLEFVGGFRAKTVVPLSTRNIKSRPITMKKNSIQTTSKKPNDKCEYEIRTENGKYTRYVKPYFQEFKTFAKGRWIGREVLEVFCREFGAHPPSYWKNAIRNGQVRINKDIIGADYRFKNSDALLHRTHR